MADNIRATPQNATLGAIANFLKQTYAPQRTQQMQGVMELLGVPALARTAERMSYGEPVTNINKANVPLLPADTAEAAMLAGPPLASLARRVGTNLVQTAPYVARDLAQSMTSPMRSYVVKPKGGNWLAGSVERAIEPMKTAEPGRMTEEQLLRGAWENTRPLTEQQAAMNRWLETKLGKYMKNEMATPEDPVRALAERGVLHVDPEQLNFRQEMHGRYMEPGQTAVAQSPAAKSWEGASDLTVGQMPAGQLLQQGYAEQMPWLAKVPPETPVYMPSQSSVADDLGFSHLADELKNAINPASGLPENLRLKYSDLEKVTVPQAVERVAKINEWRAAQKAEADMARAMGPATQVVKEYPEQGFKWVELRQPKETGRAVSVEKIPDEIQGMDDAQARRAVEEMAYDEGFDPGTPEFDQFVEDTLPRKTTMTVDESYKALEDALKYEGETMGHCVGGYCPDVVEGRSKIYSLRDKKGQPHVTIEVAPKPLKTWRDVTAAVGPDESGKLYDEFDKIGGFNMDDTDAAFEMFIKNKGIKAPDDIVQIKGKANRAPNPEYLPAVQDFVRSGNFGKIGDLKNAGLVQLPDKRLITNKQFDEAISRISDGGDRPTNEWFMNVMRGDPSWWEEMKGAFEGFAQGGQVRGYAEGGQVSGANFPTDDFDPARIDAIVGELHALNAG